MRVVTVGLLCLLTLAACGGPGSPAYDLQNVSARAEPAYNSETGYERIDPATAAPVRLAVTQWHDCIVYGIEQVDAPNESAIAIAEAAMAGCVRAETNLEDKLFTAMSGADDPREVRAMAHDEMAGFREPMRSMAIRLVLRKHQEERAAARGPVRTPFDWVPPITPPDLVPAQRPQH